MQYLITTKSNKGIVSDLVINNIRHPYVESWHGKNDLGIVFEKLVVIGDLDPVIQINITDGIISGFSSIEDLNDGAPTWEFQCKYVEHIENISVFTFSDVE